MHDKTKLKIAVFLAIFGTLSLFVISSFMKIEPISVHSIDDKLIAQTVVVNGIVTNAVVDKNNKTTFFLDESLVSFVVFSNVPIEKNQNITVTGRVGEYQGTLQVLADRIVINS